MPVYLLTSSESPQTGGVLPLKAPQSSTVTFSCCESGWAESLSFGVPTDSVKSPLSEPVLAMSTVPTEAASPGRIPEAVRIADDWLSDMVSVPVEKTFAGLAEEAVKSAPEATVTPTAASTVASVARVRRGCRESVARRDKETP